MASVPLNPLSEGLLSQLVDALPALVSYIDRDHLYRFNNKAYEYWFGQSREVLPGRHLRDVLGEAIYSDVHKHLDVALSGETVSFELTIETQSAGSRHIQASYVPHRDEDQRVVGVFSMATDLTTQKETEIALRASDERLRSVLAATPDGIITIDSSGIVETFSGSAERLFGYRADEVIGSNVKMLMPSPYQEEHDGYLKRYLDTSEKRIIGIGRQVTARRKDGSTFPMDLAVDEIKLTDSRHFTGIIHDITDRVAREDELRQAQKMKAVGQLTGGVAHDFNNLLTVIVGNLEMLETRLAGDVKSTALLERASEAAELGAQLTARMLAFARRQPLEPENVDVNELVRELIDLLHRSLGENIEITSILASDLGLTRADPTQLKNALLNLCINARDAMPGGGKLTIETVNVALDSEYADAKVEVSAGDYIGLSVSDNGTGITPEIQNRVFEPFFTTKDVGAGTGLGLSTIYGFAKQSGGHLTLYSEEGIGTTVSLFLPRVEAVGESERIQSLAVDDVTTPRTTILVVEDDHRVRATTIARLEHLGYTILEAADGKDALEILKQDIPIDLLFTDVVMPGGMMGGELAEAAKLMRPGLSMLFTSGYTEQAGIQAGVLEAGGPLLRKPYRMADLTEKLREVLGS